VVKFTDQCNKAVYMRNVLYFLMLLLGTSSSLCAVPQAIVFDFGGVMTKDSHWRAMDDFVRESLGLSQEEFETANLDKYASLEQGETDEEFWLSYACDHWIALPSGWGALFRSAMKESLGINLGMYALVAELRGQFMLVAMLSNTTKRRSQVFRRFGLYEPFDPCLLSWEIGFRKPDSKAYEYLLDRLGLSAKEVIFIDNKLENIEVAKELGMDAILFESEEQLRQLLYERGVLVSTDWVS
jgi:FMN phosphatase YigB (HAD superfamily)